MSPLGGCALGQRSRRHVPLVIVGGIVRVSDSGLGCGPAGSGLDGWPFCNGDVVPGVNLNSIIEYSHRALAGVVGIMMIALAVLAWRRYRSNTGLVRATIAVGRARGGPGPAGRGDRGEGPRRGAGGGASRAGDGAARVAALRLRASSPRTSARQRPTAGRASAPSRLWPRASCLCTIVAGGYMAGTQNYGRADYQLGDGAHHACGKEFPTCNGEFMPFGDARLVDIHLTHRAFMYIATLLVLALVVLTLRRRPGPGVVRSALVRRRDPLLPGARRRAERVARRVRGADRAPPRARHAAVERVVGLTLQLYPVRAPGGRALAAPRAEAVPA